MSRYTSHRLGTARIDAMARNIINGMLSNSAATSNNTVDALVERAAVLAFQLIDQIDAQLAIRKQAVEANTETMPVTSDDPGIKGNSGCGAI